MAMFIISIIFIKVSPHTRKFRTFEKGNLLTLALIEAVNKKGQTVMGNII